MLRCSWGEGEGRVIMYAFANSADKDQMLHAVASD